MSDFKEILLSNLLTFQFSIKEKPLMLNFKNIAQRLSLLQENAKKINLMGSQMQKFLQSQRQNEPQSRFELRFKHIQEQIDKLKTKQQKDQVRSQIILKQSQSTKQNDRRIEQIIQMHGHLRGRTKQIDQVSKMNQTKVAQQLDKIRLSIQEIKNKHGSLSEDFTRKIKQQSMKNKDLFSLQLQKSIKEINQRLSLIPSGDHSGRSNIGNQQLKKQLQNKQSVYSNKLNELQQTNNKLNRQKQAQMRNISERVTDIQNTLLTSRISKQKELDLGYISEKILDLQSIINQKVLTPKKDLQRSIQLDKRTASIQKSTIKQVKKQKQVIDIDKKLRNFKYDLISALQYHKQQIKSKQTETPNKQQIHLLKEEMLHLQKGLSKRADDLSVKKYFNFLQQKINFIYSVLNPQQNKQALGAKHSCWRCLSCDKGLDNFKGIIGKFLTWEKLPKREMITTRNRSLSQLKRQKLPKLQAQNE